MGGLTSILGGGGVSSGELQTIRNRSLTKELARLRESQRIEREQSKFLQEEGKGISERTSLKLGTELDLEDLSVEEQELRRSGRLTGELLL